MLNDVTLWLFNIAMENGPFIDGLLIKNCDFSGSMLIYQRVNAPFKHIFIPCPTPQRTAAMSPASLSGKQVAPGRKRSSQSAWSKNMGFYNRFQWG
jgi:hypothetical protein